VAVTLTSSGNSAVFKSNEPDYLKDPWLSAPRSRGVWLYQILETRADLGKGPYLVRACK